MRSMLSVVGMGHKVNSGFGADDEEYDWNEGVKVEERGVATHSGETISRLPARPLSLIAGLTLQVY